MRPTTEGPWRIDVVLGCPHRTAITIGEYATFEEAWDAPDHVPLRADGWPKAHKCDQCNRYRAVVCLHMERIR